MYGEKFDFISLFFLSALSFVGIFFYEMKSYLKSFAINEHFTLICIFMGYIYGVMCVIHIGLENDEKKKKNYTKRGIYGEEKRYYST